MTTAVPPAYRVDTLTADLRALGLGPGDVVLVHCSLRALGPVDGGPATLAGALRAAVGPSGTVVVPAQTPDNSVSSPAYHAATAGLTDEERLAYEERMPGFDPAVTPSFGVGAFAEHVRRLPGAVRSRHPQTSFSAWGPRAAELMRVHDLDSHLGERSPLAALEAAGARTLLLGVGYATCTALHLAEYRLRRPPPRRPYRCYVLRDGRRERLDFEAPHLDAAPFPAIGAELDRAAFTRRGTVGDAPARLLPISDAVGAAVTWMDAHIGR
ncbi:MULTISPECIES: AAC(3) family N-acetyltransferase [unclassified Micromonospora]|uniref:aminoglycoside N(3)-acetyltransferase n=1 Tax=unclassified Micromonospora TaxID=2617518 RepID=UPI00188DF13B|nr:MULTISPECIES: AAC(3) family N-acetyltransferase [unclassified Micromonospora]MBF5030401.1 AAC(3) family N-acetyltransferase [Micromonospora sp. ANENR4]MCZ7478180.1 AAC(3) family N-acetyltransferase [Micromonospora sp. WMMC273]WBC02897.1 AAC(3) family N-acetyltransferase [Micromonospora sp. WMMA1976]